MCNVYTNHIHIYMYVYMKSTSLWVPGEQASPCVLYLAEEMFLR